MQCVLFHFCISTSTQDTLDNESAVKVGKRWRYLFTCLHMLHAIGDHDMTDMQHCRQNLEQGGKESVKYPIVKLSSSTLYFSIRNKITRQLHKMGKINSTFSCTNLEWFTQLHTCWKHWWIWWAYLFSILRTKWSYVADQCESLWVKMDVGCCMQSQSNVGNQIFMQVQNDWYTYVVEESVACKFLLWEKGSRGKWRKG